MGSFMTRSSERPANEQLAGAMALGGLPLLDVIVLIGAGLVQDTHVSLELFPLLFAALAALLCRLLDVSFWWAVLYVLGCAAVCWMAAVVVGLFDALFLPW